MATPETLSTRQKLQRIAKHSFETAIGSALVLIAYIDKVSEHETLLGTPLISGIVGGLAVGAVCSVAARWTIQDTHDGNPSSPQDYPVDEPLAEVATLSSPISARPMM